MYKYFFNFFLKRGRRGLNGLVPMFAPFIFKCKNKIRLKRGCKK